MILGIGTDIVETARIASLLDSAQERFLARTFTEEEQALSLKRGKDGAHCANTLAKRFAAKEACAKALGTGISGGILFKEIGVINDTQGAPTLTLTGEALKRLEVITPAGKTARLHISISDEKTHAGAYVIIEAV